MQFTIPSLVHKYPFKSVMRIEWTGFHCSRHTEQAKADRNYWKIPEKTLKTHFLPVQQITSLLSLWPACLSQVSEQFTCSFFRCEKWLRTCGNTSGAAARILCVLRASSRKQKMRTWGFPPPTLLFRKLTPSPSHHSSKKNLTWERQEGKKRY